MYVNVKMQLDIPRLSEENYVKMIAFIADELERLGQEAVREYSKNPDKCDFDFLVKRGNSTMKLDPRPLYLNNKPNNA